MRINDPFYKIRGVNLPEIHFLLKRVTNFAQLTWQGKFCLLHMRVHHPRLDFLLYFRLVVRTSWKEKPIPKRIESVLHSQPPTSKDMQRGIIKWPKIIMLQLVLRPDIGPPMCRSRHLKAKTSNDLEDRLFIMTKMKLWIRSSLHHWTLLSDYKCVLWVWGRLSFVRHRLKSDSLTR